VATTYHTKVVRDIHRQWVHEETMLPRGRLQRYLATKCSGAMRWWLSRCSWHLTHCCARSLQPPYDGDTAMGKILAASREPRNAWEKKLDRALFSGNCNQPETSPRPR